MPNDKFECVTDSLSPPWSNFHETAANAYRGHYPPQMTPDQFTTADGLQSMNNANILEELETYNIVSFVNASDYPRGSHSKGSMRARCSSCSSDDSCATVEGFSAQQGQQGEVPDLGEILKNAHAGDFAALVEVRRRLARTARFVQGRKDDSDKPCADPTLNAKSQTFGSHQDRSSARGETVGDEKITPSANPASSKEPIATHASGMNTNAEHAGPEVHLGEHPAPCTNASQQGTTTFDKNKKPSLFDRMGSPVLRAKEKHVDSAQESAGNEHNPEQSQTRSHSPPNVFTDAGLERALEREANGNRSADEARAEVPTLPTRLPTGKKTHPAHIAHPMTLVEMLQKQELTDLKREVQLPADKLPPRRPTDMPLLPPSPDMVRIPRQDRTKKGYLETLAEVHANLEHRAEYATLRAEHAEDLQRRTEIERQHFEVLSHHTTADKEHAQRNLAEHQLKYTQLQMEREAQDNKLRAETAKRMVAEDKCRLWEQNFADAVRGVEDGYDNFL
jgi:hypothetical protein